ncbi:MAG: hypothetical protein HGB08_03215 [Candidatus Moranbacteria bacterium]|nr:hypothetical protein [Candidatus Moranbacteria bacterium]
MFNEFLNGLFAVGYRIPSAVELVIAEIAHYETHGAYLFPGTYLMTSSFFVPDGYVERMVALVRCDGRIGFGACPEDACGDDIAIPLVKKE